MTLVEFIRDYDIDHAFDRISVDRVEEIENTIGVSFGEQLKKYVVKYGYLGYKHVELLGVNNHQGINSDMVKQTLKLHEHFEKTKNLIAIEDLGNGDYSMVDSEDSVYRFVATNNELIEQNTDLFEYILQRFLDL